MMCIMQEINQAITNKGSDPKTEKSALGIQRDLKIFDLC